MSEKIYSMLFVDDEPAMFTFMARILEKNSKIKVQTAKEGAEAIDKCSNDTDLILLDIHLGEEAESGIDIASKIRSFGYDGLICMFTGDASPTLLFQAVLAGANDYILKGPTCNIERELTRLIEMGRDREEIGDGEDFNPIEESGYLRTIGLTAKETELLNHFVEFGYPRIKEFAAQMNITETCLWKRLARIREKLNIDSTSQIAHLLTSISMMDVRNSRKRKGPFKRVVSTDRERQLEE